MARAKRHGGGAKSKLSQRYKGDRPGATPRTETIRVYTERQLAATGLLPSIAEVAKALVMTPAKVEHHYRILGLL